VVEFERQEGETVIPPFPDEDDLREFRVSGPGARRSYALDTRHLALGEDGMTRYSVVVRSAAGGENVFHEGIDCLEKRYKTYAYGRHDGTFREREAPGWRPLTDSGSGAFRYELARHHLCDPFWNPRETAAVLEGLRHQQGHLGSGFGDSTAY
jgi:hypothetical protein